MLYGRFIAPSLRGYNCTMPDVASIKLFVSDVDGVLTDGALIIDDRGVESKRFHVRDGLAFKAAMSLGLRVGVLTSRSTSAVTLRMTELGVRLLGHGSTDKKIGLENLCREAGVLPEETAYLGDDLLDLPALLNCGYPMAVADAASEVREVAAFITKTRGGRGAAREAIEHILKTQGRWDELLERYGIG